MKTKSLKDFLLVMCASLLFAQCSKDDDTSSGKTYCWKCTIKQATTVPGNSQYNSQSANYQEFCNASANDVKATEKAGTSIIQALPVALQYL
ncbi:MAG: hypothetical protein ACRYFL_09745 [Janthinobacterium lividum]